MATLELLTSQSAGQLVGVGAETIRLWARTGILVPAAVTPTGIQLFDRATVERVAAARRARRRAGPLRGTGSPVGSTVEPR